MFVLGVLVVILVIIGIILSLGKEDSSEEFASIFFPEGKLFWEELVKTMEELKKKQLRAIGKWEED